VAILLMALSLAAIPSLLPQPIAAQRGEDFTLYPVLSRDAVEPGQDNVLFVEVRNNGESEVADIRLSYLAPQGWAVELDPASIGLLSPGSFQTVEVRVRPPATAGRGQYQVTVVAEAGGARRIASAWLRVEASTTIWLWVGIAIAAAVAAIFVLIFLRTSRR
jgi:uncharacterized membrane protein